MLKRIFIYLLIPLCVCVGRADVSLKNQKRLQDYTSAKYQNYPQNPNIARFTSQNVRLTSTQVKQNFYPKTQSTNNPSAVKKQTVSTPQCIRVYEGCIKKFWFFKSWFYKIDYGLYHGEKCIACLKADNVLMIEHLKRSEGNNVLIKGIPDYMNKEPFLVINVKEICGEDR